MEKTIEELEADAEALRERVKVEREVSDYWYNRYMELKDEMQRMQGGN